MRTLLIALLLTVPLFAQNQNNEIGIAFGGAEMGDFGDAGTFGISYNRYWTRGLSTKFDITGFGAELTTVDVGPGGASTAGDFAMSALSAQMQYHFLRDRRFSPYFGAGLAVVTTTLENTPIGDIEADGNVTGIAGAGLDLNLGRRWAISADLTYMPHEAEFDDVETLDLDPVTVSIGAKFRW